MKIGIDARILKHGVGTYIDELLNHLIIADKKNRYIVFTPIEAPISRIHCIAANFHPVMINAPVFSFREQAVFYKHLHKIKLDVFHATSYPSPILRQCPLIVTIHDVLCKVRSDFFPAFKGLKRIAARIYYDFMNWYSIKFSAHIITVSQYAKREILKFYPNINPNKITVIYNAVGSHFKPSPRADVLRVKTKYNIPGNYILFVGTLNPRKNLINLLKAFAGLKNLHKKKYKLVVAARIDKRYPLPLSLLNELNIQNLVILPGYIQKEDLPGLYSGADVFVLPSFHESFGLPVLEAFACGTPVITSNVTALPEIVDKAAKLVDPAKVEDLKKAIMQIIGDKTIRERFKKEGIERAKRFQWHIAAEKTIRIYESIYKHK